MHPVLPHLSGCESSASLTHPRPHLPCRLRGFLFFGVANAFSSRLHAAAASLDAGMHGEGLAAEGGTATATEDEPGGFLTSSSGSGPLGARQEAAAARLYTRDSSKHGGALCAFATAPKFLLLVSGQGRVGEIG